MILTATTLAVAPGIQSNFLASGGTSPYSYSVRPGGAGGTINSSGWYTAPSSLPSDALQALDTVVATDSAGNFATAEIVVGSPLQLFCDIIQSQLALPEGRVWVWNQKQFQPTDSGLYIAVSILSCKPFGSSNRFLASSDSQNQGVNMFAAISVDIMSRGLDALNRKEEVIQALNSSYSQNQQALNSFYVSQLSSGFVNLAAVDGAAIPYRFNITVNIQYVAQKTSSVDYYSSFPTPTEVVEA